MMVDPFSAELRKIAEEQKRRPGIAAGFVAAVPFVAGKALSEIPKGLAEEGVYNLIAKDKTPLKEALRASAGKAGKQVAGIFTAPLFLSGIKDIKEAKTPKQKQIGVAKVVGAGTIYAGATGIVEQIARKGLAANQVNRAKGIAAARAVIGAGAATGTALGLSRQLRREQQDGPTKKPTASGRILAPLALGAGISFGKGVLDEVGGGIGELGYKQFRQKMSDPTTLRQFGARGAGRVAGGALGALALSELLRRQFPKEKEKRAQRPPYLGPTAGDLYDYAYGWTREKSTPEIRHQYETLLAQKRAEGTPTRRAIASALHESLVARGVDVPAPPESGKYIGRVKAATTLGDGMMISAASAAPMAFWAMIQSMPADQKDPILNEALDRILVQKNIKRVSSGGIWGVPFAEVLNSGKKTIGASPGTAPEIVAHELGHLEAGKMRQFLQKPVFSKALLAAQATAVIVPMMAIESFRDASFTTPEDLRRRADFLNTLGKFTGLAAAPLLLEEALASRAALNTMRQIGATPNQLFRSKLTLGAGLASYAAPLAIPFIGAGLLKHRARKAERKAMRQ